MDLIFLAGGNGKRFAKSIGAKPPYPKALHFVKGIPLISYSIKTITSLVPVDRIICAVHHKLAYMWEATIDAIHVPVNTRGSAESLKTILEEYSINRALVVAADHWFPEIAVKKLDLDKNFVPLWVKFPLSANRNKQLSSCHLHFDIGLFVLQEDMLKYLRNCNDIDLREALKKADIPIYGSGPFYYINVNSVEDIRYLELTL